MMMRYVRDFQFREQAKKAAAQYLLSLIKKIVHTYHIRTHLHTHAFHIITESVIRGNSNTFTHVDLRLFLCVYSRFTSSCSSYSSSRGKIKWQNHFPSQRRKIFFLTTYFTSYFSFKEVNSVRNFILCAQISEVPIKKCYNHTCGEKLTFSFIIYKN